LGETGRGQGGKRKIPRKEKKNFFFFDDEAEIFGHVTWEPPGTTGNLRFRFRPWIGKIGSWRFLWRFPFEVGARGMGFQVRTVEKDVLGGKFPDKGFWRQLPFTRFSSGN